MAKRFEYKPPSLFDGVLLRIAKHGLEQIDAFFEEYKFHLRSAEKDLEKRVASSGRESGPDDQWVNDFTQLEEFAWLSSEFAIIGLWRCVELYRQDAIGCALGSKAVQGLFNHRKFQEKLRSQEIGIEESRVRCAKSVDELRCLNNAIKHERRVNDDLAKFPRWKKKKGDKLGDLEKHYYRLQPLVQKYLIDLAERLKTKFPPLHGVKNAKKGWR